MRVFEAKMVYSLISLGEEVRLDKPAKVADYLRSAFDENPMQEAFYCVHLDRKNHPLGRQLITLGTATSMLIYAHILRLCSENICHNVTHQTEVSSE